MTDREAMKMALEALEDSMYPQKKQFDAIVGLKQALAQPEQDAVAWVKDGVLWNSDLPEKFTGCLYTAPPKREWVGLTDEEISELYYLSGYGSKEYDGGANSFARAIEAKLKEKNT